MVGTPAALAAAAWSGAGSMPSTGIPAAAKCLSRVPSLLPISTTSDSGPRPRLSISASAWRRPCSTRTSE